MTLRALQHQATQQQAKSLSASWCGLGMKRYFGLDSSLCATTPANTSVREIRFERPEVGT